MTLGGTPAGRRLFCALALACAFAFTLQTIERRASAQKAQKSSRPQKAAPAPSPAAANASNGDYGAKIREYTTEKYFLTELVDHLPASDRVPSPDKVLGYVVGTPGKLTHTKDVHRYFRELERTSPRVKVFTAPEKSEEGREQILVAVGDEASMARLDRYKEITARLADPRGLSDAEAQRLIGEGKAFYWASGSIHSPETGSPEMLMEMAYRLAVEESPFIRDIRKNVVVLITPVLEVDGRDKMVDLYNYRKANPGKAVAAARLLGQVRRARQQPRRSGHGARAHAQHDEDFPRVAPASPPRPARVGALPLHLDGHGPVQRVARPDRG